MRLDKHITKYSDINYTNVTRTIIRDVNVLQDRND